MKRLICYVSKHGATAKCAKLIGEKLPEHDLIDIKKSVKVNIADYDQIILGTPVYFGNINKRFKKFVTDHKDTLLTKDLRIFTVGMDDKNVKETWKRNFDSEILNHAIIKYAGGAYHFEDMNFIERFIVRKIGSISESLENFRLENIDALLKER